MVERDPLDRLTGVADLPERPDPDFAAQLLDDLLDDLTGAAPEGGPELTVLTLEEDDMEAPKRSWTLLLIAAAAIIAVLVGVVLASSDDDGSPVIEEVPPTTGVTPETTMAAPATTEAAPSTTAPAPTTTEAPVEAFGRLSAATARTLLDAAGGEAGLTIGTIEERHAWNAVTFDPLDNTRVLLADIDFENPTSPELWVVADGAARLDTIPWIEENPRPSGRFMRDGTILSDAFAGQSDFPVLTNEGELLATIDFASFPGGVAETQGDRGVAMITPFSDRCPYSAVNLGTPEGNSNLDDRQNAFIRVMIVEPDVAVAFPYFPGGSSCEPQSSMTAKAWDITTGEPLPDHPFDGRPYARGAVSGDGSRGIVLDGGGEVSVISMATGETIVELGPADSGKLITPLALDETGTIAVVAEEDGSVTVWHVDTGEVLLATTSGARPSAMGLEAAAGIAYDATRVALLDDAEGSWTILTLDPDEWVSRACATGLSIDAAELEANGLDPAGAC